MSEHELSEANRLRTVRLRPYRKDCGPTFTLETFDCGYCYRIQRDKIGYRLRQHDHGRTVVLFEGSDIGNSPMYCIDSDRTVAAVLVLLTLKPGDTDSEYFEHYTAAQLEFCDTHAEALELESIRRFGEY